MSEKLLYISDSLIPTARLSFNYISDYLILRSVHFTRSVTPFIHSEKPYQAKLVFQYLQHPNRITEYLWLSIQILRLALICFHRNVLILNKELKAFS